jgi:hypothetical protein
MKIRFTSRCASRWNFHSNRVTECTFSTTRKYESKTMKSEQCLFISIKTCHKTIIQGLSELADQNNTVKSSSSGNNRKNILKNPSSLDFKIRTFLIDQSHVDIKSP